MKKTVGIALIVAAVLAAAAPRASAAPAEPLLIAAIFWKSSEMVALFTVRIDDVRSQLAFV